MTPVSSPTPRLWGLRRVAAALLAVSALCVSVSAQIGSGWTQYTPSMRLQRVGDVTYSTSNGVETFRITSSNTGEQRCEQRIENEWSSGTNQFEGTVRVVSLQGTGISLKQTFQPQSGAFLMIAVRSNGELYEVGGGVTLASNIIGNAQRINTVTDVSAGRTYVYVNGTLRQTRTGGNPPFHDKYGAYRLGSGRGPITVEWSNIRFFRGGSTSGGSVSAPSFSPAGGTFSAPVSVSISSSTSGATIRYTTNGTNPTSSSGTVYTGPVTISSTTNLRAIAYTSSASSSVTSATYTIGTGGGTTLTYEAEAMSPIHSGTGITVQSDANTSGGQWISLDAENTGSWVEFTTPSVPAGTYQLSVSYKTNNNRGIATVRVDGTQLGSNVDQYGYPSTYPTRVLGTVTFSSSGSHKIRMVVAGKNSSSSNYVLSADKFTLTPQ